MYNIGYIFSVSFDLRTICNELGEVKWKFLEIGVQLGISRNKLMEFKEQRDPLAASIHYWLAGNVKDAQIPLSWSSIVNALESSHVDELGLGRKIRAKYCPGEPFLPLLSTAHTGFLGGGWLIREKLKC